MSRFDTRLFMGSPRADAAPYAILPSALALLEAGQYQTKSGRRGVQASLTPGAAGGKGIAVIEISGPLEARFGYWDLSYEEIADAVQAAAADPKAAGILLRIDSPGGSAANVEVAANAIREAAAAKPVWAFADPEAFSAAYWLASQAQRLLVASSGLVGSVGVIARHMDMTGFAEQMGVKITEVTFGARKNELSPFRPLDDSARASIQGVVDSYGELFVAAVAEGRGMDAKAVRATEAGIYTARESVEIGFTDGVGTFAEALGEMTESLRGSGAKASARARSEKQGTGDQGQDPAPQEVETMATEKTDAGAQATPSTPPALPNDANGEPKQAAAVQQPKAAVGVDMAALLGAMGRYKLDGIGLANQIHAAAATTDDAVQIAQAYALAGKPAAGLELLKPGTGLKAQQFRDAMCNLAADKSDAEHVDTAVTAQDGLREKSNGGGMAAAVDRWNADYRKRKGMEEVA